MSRWCNGPETVCLHEDMQDCNHDYRNTDAMNQVPSIASQPLDNVD